MNVATWVHSHKMFQYYFCTRAPNSSNQNVVFIGYDDMIGYFLSTSTKLKFESL